MAGVVNGLIQLICVPAAVVGAAAGVVNSATTFFNDIGSGQSFDNIGSVADAANSANSTCKTIVLAVFIVAVCLPFVVGAILFYRCYRKRKLENRQQEYQKKSLKTASDTQQELATLLRGAGGMGGMGGAAGMQGMRQRVNGPSVAGGVSQSEGTAEDELDYELETDDVLRVLEAHPATVAELLRVLGGAGWADDGPDRKKAA